VVSSRQLQHKTCPEFRPAPRRQIKVLEKMATHCVMQNARKVSFQYLHFASPSEGGFALGKDGSENAVHLFSIR
jgi:hypothetical protein